MMRRRPSLPAKGAFYQAIACFKLVVILHAILFIPVEGRSMLSRQIFGIQTHANPSILKQPFLVSSRVSPRTNSSILNIPNNDKSKEISPLSFGQLRGGQQRASPGVNPWNKSIELIAGTVNWCARTVLPVVVGCVRAIVVFYRALPTDAILAQAGLVSCFAGGYYPTLFSALQAAQQCGWQTMINALGDLTEEASKALEATAQQAYISSEMTARQVFYEKTNIVLKTIDPMKINQASGALYTTWMGVSSVLEREFAKTITLSLTLAGYLEQVAQFVLAPPLRLCISDDYKQWIPVVIGWGCKAAAMQVAWRIQRVLTATTSALTGGVMFARALLRMASKKGFTYYDPNDKSVLEDIIGFPLACLGLYSQVGSGFDFEVPFPLSLVTWPFDWAERAIEWQITKEAS